MLVPSTIVQEWCYLVDGVEPHEYCSLGSMEGGLTFFTSEAPYQEDHTIYQYDAIELVDDGAGGLTITRTPTSVAAPLRVSRVDDYGGDGLEDVLYPIRRSYGQTTEFGDPALLGRYYPSGSVALGYKTMRHLGSAPDLLIHVQNGLGAESTWDYAPLSSSGVAGCTSPQSIPFYHANFDEVPDGEHFFFTSSTYVVGRFATSNGVGGLNPTCYRYEDAMYNSQGRGFLGFRKIIEEQALDDAENNRRTVTTYQQKFPLVGAETETTVSLATDPLGAPPLMRKTQHWTTTCPDYVSGPPAEVCFNYVDQEVNETRKLTMPRAWVSTTRITRSYGGTDLTYGNASWEEKQITDGTTTYSDHTAYTYDYADASAWWIDRLQQKVVTTNAAAYSAPPEMPEALFPENNEKQVVTTFGFYPDSHPSWARLALSIHVEGREADAWADTHFDTYDDFGNLKASTDTAGNLPNARTTERSYDPTGYFLVTETRPLDHQQITTTDPKTGQVTWMQAPNGLITTTTLDPFGRTLQVDQSGLPPTYHRVLDCDASCPPLARFRMLHHQNGTPEVSEYADPLGRKIETRSTAFDGVTSIVDAVGFDARGHTVHTSEPSDQPGGLYFMELKEFDALDRPHRKLVDKTGYTDANGLPHESFEIEYFPDGLTTSITLDGQLTASRTYNALGQVIETVDTAGGTTTYRYDGRGHLILIRDPAGNDTRMTFDDLGHRIAIKDPDRGDWAFKSNGAGELIEQTDANGDVVTFGHDDLGRVIDRSLNGQLESRWTFDLTAKGTLDQETKLDVHTGQPIFTRTFGYDGDLREVLRVESFEGRAYQTRQIYDCQGHLWGIEYPNGEAVEMHYSDEGYLVRETNPLALPPDDLYREVTAMNPRGQIEAETFGNHLIGRYDYFASTGQVRHLLVCQESDPSCSSPLQDLEYGYVDPFANLTHRTKTFHGAVPGVSLTSVREDYDYDNLQRLAKATRTWTGSGAPAPVSVDYQYDALGNIQRKADYAIDYDYGAQGRANPHLAGPHAVTQIDKIGAGVVDDFLYDGNGNMIAGDGRSIAYTVFNKPEMISEGAVTTYFFYGPNHARYHQDVGTKTTRYAGGGLFEEIEDAAGTEQKAFVGANVVITTGPNGREVHWLHLDQLGSVETVTDADGEVVEAHGYDAFGAPRNSTWEDNGRMLHSGEFASETTTHGFTKHEHLDAHGLIHMNGRAYDPGLGRFLSVNPFIADITNAQQLNAYSYVLNNPLSGTDPTGYLAETIRDKIHRAWEYLSAGATSLVSPSPSSKSNGSDQSKGKAANPAGGQREEVSSLKAFSDKDPVGALASTAGGFLRGSIGLPATPESGHELSFGLGELAGSVAGLTADLAAANTLSLGGGGGLAACSGGVTCGLGLAAATAAAAGTPA